MYYKKPWGGGYSLSPLIEHNTHRETSGQMKRIAIIEDDSAYSSKLKSYFERYREKRGVAATVDIYECADTFLQSYEKGAYDMIFMDIEMPGTDGMTASELIRKKDDDVLLIFVTNLSQYALKGYEVHAYDFIVKPISYYDFALKMERAFVVVQNNEDDYLTVSFDREIKMIKISSIRYIEVMKHSLTYHTVEGDFNEANKPMITIQKQLQGFNFEMCNRCFLVNLKYVTGIKDDIVYLGDETLKISRPKKNDFVNMVSKYFLSMRS